MSIAAIGVLSGSKITGFEDGRENAEKEPGSMAKEAEDEQKRADENGGEAERLRREMSKESIRRTEEEEDEEEEEGRYAAEGIELVPRVSLKTEIEKDKDDDSLRRWKEQLLGSVDLNSVGENLEPEVKILSLSILSPGRPDIVLPLPVAPNSKGVWFTLKEGSHYRLKFTFSIANNIVSGLRYTNIIWKTGVRVDRSKEMLGTFSPQLETYTYETPEETTPSGLFARGTYCARTKFVDDDGKCYFDINYTFDIRREWPSIS